MSELLSVLESRRVVDVHALPDEALCAELEELVEARDRLDALICRRLQAADVKDSTATVVGRSTRATLVEEHRRSPGEASRLVFVARRLPLHPLLAAAFDAGDVSLEHVRMIAGCLGKLPAEWQADGEQILVEAARHADPASLAPVVDKLRVAAGVEDSPAAAAERKYDDRWVTTATTFRGMLHLEGMLDPLSATTLLAALDALTSTPVPEDDRTSGQRTADALVELAQHSLERGGLPEVGRNRPQVVVTVPLDDLRAELAEREATARLGYDTTGVWTVSPNTARMLACDAGILPAVLGGRSEVLDLGRATPAWTPAQHRAARLRDGGCVWPQCQAPLDRCELHHLTFWSRSGRTDLANSAHVCRFHHWLVHHKPWQIWRDEHGAIQVRRT